jgi:MFS family permease
MIQGTLPFLVGIVAGFIAAGLVTILEDRFRKRRKGWIIPLVIVGILASIVIFFCILMETWEGLYRANPYPFYGVVVALATFVFFRRIAFFRLFFDRNPQGKITHPRNGDLISRLFRAEGTVDSLSDDQHLMLVVEVGGLMWPKGEVQVKNTSWTSEVYEEGTPPDGDFTLSLYLVGDKGYDEIVAWLERGELTGDYPGLVQIKDGIKLHSIKLCLGS